MKKQYIVAKKQALFSYCAPFFCCSICRNKQEALLLECPIKQKRGKFFFDEFKYTWKN